MQEAAIESLWFNRTPSCQTAVLLAWHNGNGRCLAPLNTRPLYCQLGDSVELETYSSPVTVHIQRRQKSTSARERGTLNLISEAGIQGDSEFDFCSAGLNSSPFLHPQTAPNCVPRTSLVLCVFSSTHLPSLQGLRIPPACSPTVRENLWSSTDIPRMTREGVNSEAFPWGCALAPVQCRETKEARGGSSIQQMLLFGSEPRELCVHCCS